MKASSTATTSLQKEKQVSKSHNKRGKMGLWLRQRLGVRIYKLLFPSLPLSHCLPSDNLQKIFSADSWRGKQQLFFPWPSHPAIEGHKPGLTLQKPKCRTCFCQHSINISYMTQISHSCPCFQCMPLKTTVPAHSTAA